MDRGTMLLGKVETKRSIKIFQIFLFRCRVNNREVIFHVCLYVMVRQYPHIVQLGL